MRNIKLTVIVFSICILIIALGYFSWMLYQKLPGQNESPLKAISENTALIIQVNRPYELSQDILSQNLLWKELTVIPYFSSVKNDLSKIDSLIKTNKELLQVIKKYPLYLAMTMVTRSSYGFLFLSSIPEKNGEDLITGILEKNIKGKINILKNQYGSANLVRVTLKGTREPFYFAVRKGVFMGSCYPELVTKAIDQLYLNIPSLSGSSFQRVEKTTGKKVDANIYINYHLAIRCNQVRRQRQGHCRIALNWTRRRPPCSRSICSRGFSAWRPTPSRSLPTAAKVVELAREKQFLLAHVGLGFHAGYPELDDRSPMAARVKQAQLFVHGSPSAQFAAAIARPGRAHRVQAAGERVHRESAALDFAGARHRESGAARHLHQRHRAVDAAAGLRSRLSLRRDQGRLLRPRPGGAPRAQRKSFRHAGAGPERRGLHRRAGVTTAALTRIDRRSANSGRRGQGAKREDTGGI